MPIGSGEPHEIYLNRYTNLIKPAVDGYELEGKQIYDAIRADFITKTGSINKSVIQHIYNSDLVIADLTDLNPNVFYELGVRHALRNGTILVALEGTKLPFDVGDLRVVFYKDRVGAEKQVVPEIQQLISSIYEGKSIEDSPVFAVLPTLGEPETRDLHEAKAKANAAEADAAELRVKLELAEEANLRLRDSFTTFERTVNTILETLRPNEREAATEAVGRAVKERSSRSMIPARRIPGVEEQPRTIFVVMPYRNELQPIWEIIKEAGVGENFQVLRADEMVAPGRITTQIMDAIARAGLIVADITGQNPNVLFEIGMAQSLGKELILLSQERERIPFDIADLRVIFYDNSVAGAKKLRFELVSAMQHFNKNNG